MAPRFCTYSKKNSLSTPPIDKYCSFLLSEIRPIYLALISSESSLASLLLVESAISLNFVRKISSKIIVVEIRCCPSMIYRLPSSLFL